MDIPALSTAMASANVSSKVGIAVLKMAQDTLKENGEQLAEMIQSTGVDIKV